MAIRYDKTRSKAILEKIIDMNVTVTGTRGVPFIQGGVETHCEELFSRVSRLKRKTKIKIIRRSGYVTETNNVPSYKGMKIVTLYSPRNKMFEATLHTAFAVLYAGIKRPDVLHIHAVGPSLLTPFARLLGLKVVMTHHGPDYERAKWGKVAKLVLRVGEWAGVTFANRVIVISEGIGKGIEAKYGRKDYSLIANGVPAAIKNEGVDYLEEIGVEKDKYIFTLGRFVPEKGFNYLIKAFKLSESSANYKLVIAGDCDHHSCYADNFKLLAQKNGVILTGFIKGEKLQQLYTHARLFILPSFYEGLPISLLEAMSYKLDILASDIEPNKEVKLPAAFYFKKGKSEDLKNKIDSKLHEPTKAVEYDMSRYNWNNIAIQTQAVYDSLFSMKKEHHLFIPLPVFNRVMMGNVKSVRCSLRAKMHRL